MCVIDPQAHGINFTAPMKLELASGLRTLLEQRRLKTGVELAAAGGNVTPAELQVIIQQLQKILDSDNEISEIGNMQLQMLMNAGTKLLQLVSDIEDYKRRLLTHQLD